MIEINNLTKKFNTSMIFNNYNLTINENSFISIIGKSGSGKSTLLNMIGLLDDEYEGSIKINNTNIKDLKPNQKADFIRNNISYLFQNYALLDNKSVYDNLELCFMNNKVSKDKKRAKIIEVLELFGLENKIDSLVCELSGGQQQRIALGRVILLNRPIVLCDEPTGNLDFENKQLVLKILEYIRKNNHLVIVATHDKDIADKSDLIINLDEI